MPVEHTFNTGAVTINYAEYAEYKEEAASAASPLVCPLVLLHGGSARWQGSLLIPELSRRGHLYVPDLRGHGKSGWVPGHYTLNDYAEDIGSFMERVVREPAVLFGHSLGGQVAIMVAARHPHLVRALIIGDSPFHRGKLKAILQRDRQRLVTWRDMSGPGRSLNEIVEALKNAPIFVEGQPEPVPTRTIYGEDTPWFPYMAENLSLLDPDMLNAVLEFDSMHAPFDCERLFPMISCPVLIIQANPSLGGVLSDEEIERATVLLPQATVARLETVGHALDYPDKQPLLQAVSSFLDKLPSTLPRSLGL
jgi:pimeloyl-ACP methyl ester carboxylesterase